MIRLKTFDATGVAPNGRLFAGDLNALQDAVAALTDLTQNLSVASVAIGESGLQLVRYGAGEARLTGAARVDGILRGLSGLYAGQYTTTQRDAIPTGARPTGLIVFNTTNNRPEFNAGTDAAPSWQPIGAAASTSGTLVNIPAAGSVTTGSFYYATDQDVLYRSTGAAWTRVGSRAGDIHLTFNTVAATGRLLAQGQNVSRTGVNADLFAQWGTAFGAGDGTTTFTMPDLRGRMPVILGTHADVSVIGNNDGQAVANRRPKHRTSDTIAVNDTIGVSDTIAINDAIVINDTIAVASTLGLSDPGHGHVTAAAYRYAAAGASSGPAGDNIIGGSSNAVNNNTTGITLTGGVSKTGTVARSGAVTKSGTVSKTGTVTKSGTVGTNVGTDNLDAPSFIVVNGEVKL